MSKKRPRLSSRKRKASHAHRPDNTKTQSLPETYEQAKLTDEGKSDGSPDDGHGLTDSVGSANDDHTVNDPGHDDENQPPAEDHEAEQSQETDAADHDYAPAQLATHELDVAADQLTDMQNHTPEMVGLDILDAGHSRSCTETSEPSYENVTNNISGAARSVKNKRVRNYLVLLVAILVLGTTASYLITTAVLKDCLSSAGPKAAIIQRNPPAYTASPSSSPSTSKKSSRPTRPSTSRTPQRSPQADHDALSALDEDYGANMIPPESTSSSMNSGTPQEVTLIATASGPARVSSASGISQFMDSWTETFQAAEGDNISMGVDSDQSGEVSCQILVNGVAQTNETSENGSDYTYCAALA